jgi:hypothetical protein
MKKFTSILLLALIQVFVLIGCKNNTTVLTKNSNIVAENNIITEEIPQVVSNNSFEPVKVSLAGIHWEQWETAPIKVEKVIVEDYHKKWEKKGFYYIFGSYPRLTGFSDLNLEKQVNQWIKETVDIELENFRQSFEVMTNAIGKQNIEGSTSFSWQYFFSYKVLLLSPQMLSIMFEIYDTSIEVRCTQHQVTTVNIDLLQKKKLNEKDLFLTNCDYWRTLKPYIFKQIKEQYSIMMKNPNVLDDKFFDTIDLKELVHYFHFGLSPNELIVGFDQTGELGLSALFLIKIPYLQIASISSFKGFKDVYSYLTYPENWNLFERLGIFDPWALWVGKNLQIKYPELKDQAAQTTNLETIEDGIKIQIPIGNDKAVLQIEWKELASEYDNPPVSILLKPTEKEKLEPRWEQIDGVWFKKNLVENSGTIEYKGNYFTMEYTIKIQIPSSTNDQNKKEIVDRINKVLGTLRFG